MQEIKFYQKSEFIVLILVCCFPVGLFLMWKYSKWKNIVKYSITAMMLFLIIGIFTTVNTKKPPAILNSAFKTTEETTFVTTDTLECITETTEFRTIITENDKYYSTEIDESNNYKEDYDESDTVWIPQSGSKYHSSSTCSGMKDPSEVSVEKAKEQGYTACKKCYGN